MVDLNTREFQKRLKRIDRIHKAGGAFEASGTIGRAYYASMERPRRRRLSILRPLAFILAATLLFKAAIFGQLGQETYELRIATLADGSKLDRAGAWVMTADPITQAIGEAIRPLVY
ncbi:hypothetical protein [Albirhodobacter sp. R86504]|uniref:hypothetical protein n=1 Tax=Albirhodobacter sp. R86504 TaxID=3093848 RepID=UPI00366ABEB6